MLADVSSQFLCRGEYAVRNLFRSTTLDEQTGMVDVRHANIKFNQGFSTVPTRTRRGQGPVFGPSVDHNVSNLPLDIPPEGFGTHAVALGAVNFPLKKYSLRA